MKIAYLTSRYPAVSHTFIAREVRALRNRGLHVETFSVCKPGPNDAIDEDARQEADATRSLKPPPVPTLLLALGWAVLVRPVCTSRALGVALLQKEASFHQRSLWFFYFLEAILLAYWLVHGHFDHLHCHFGNNGSSTGMLAAIIAGLPFSMTCHGSELQESEHHRIAEKVKRACFVVCVSRYGKAQVMLTASPEHWHKLHVVRCGLLSMDGRADTGRNEVPVILCVARFSHEKAHLVLLNAAALLRDRGAKFRLTLVGDGPMRSAIEERIDELNLQAVVNLTGSLPPAMVDMHYRGSDVVVLSSFIEGVPVVLMEAMSKGLPVVATRVGGIPELVAHGVNGLLVSPGEAGELADALHCLLKDRELASRLGDEAIQTVQREFLLGPNINKLIALLWQTASHSLASPQAVDMDEFSQYLNPGNS